MVKKIGIAAVALIGVGLALIATRPARFRVERTSRINAPVEVVRYGLGHLGSSRSAPRARLGANPRCRFREPPHRTDTRQLAASVTHPLAHEY